MGFEGLSGWARANGLAGARALCGAMLLAGALVGCGDDTGGTGGGGTGGESGSGEGGGSTTGDTTGAGDTTATGSTGASGLEVPGGAGQAAKPDYPPGPYGIGLQSTVRDFQFVGYTRPGVDRADLELISLADFYNPTGTEVFPDDGRAWAGQPKPKALAVSVAAYWCAPCKQEWRVDVPEKQAELGPLGGEFLLLLSDGNDGGVPPVLNELNSWVSTFQVTAPATMDPTLEFQSVWASDAFPQNVLIRTSDMKIIAKASGVPTAFYWNQMRKILEGTL
jgi:hypothetical protein